jgi:putative selenate reductase
MTLGNRDSSGRRRPVDVPGSEFTIKLDTLIVAISQEPDLSLLGDEKVELASNGYIHVHPDTMETSVSGLYAGGDAALEGPESIVKALGDGRRIADAIRAKEEGEKSPPGRVRIPDDVDIVELMRRKAHRKFRVAIPHLSETNRKNFEEVTGTLREDTALDEAGRCLDCHFFCGICVSVCPNLAFMTYRTRPFEVSLPEWRKEGGQLRTLPTRCFRVDQPFQVAVLTDFCNECGNCATFCPTAGRPYRDKPRLYLKRSEFDAESDNAFMVLRRDGAWRMLARFAGASHEIEVGDEVVYSAPKLRARLDPKTLDVKKSEPTDLCAPGEVLSLRECATMYALLCGLRDSVPHLPTA